MTPNQILQLLENDDPLRQFIVAFHEHLALTNPGREIATGLTEGENAMDALGRLLVGDEVCAAVAADGTHLFVSSNLDCHSQAQASFLIEGFTFTTNTDGTRMRVTGEAKVSFLLDDGVPTRPIDKEFLVGEYVYHADEHKLVPVPGIKPACVVPFSEHGIVQYPFPIFFVLSPLLEKQLKPHELVIANRVETTDPNFVPPVTYIVRLDPLFRRSAIVFSHFGLLCALAEEKKRGNASDDKVKRVINAFSGNRCSVTQQTLGWEAAKWYKLDKTLRRYDESTLPKAQREQHRNKCNRLEELHQCIKALTIDINEFLDGVTEPTLLKPLVKRWKARARQRIYRGKLALPTVVNDSQHHPLDDFLNLVTTYFTTLLFLEQHIAKRSTEYPDLFTYTLARVGEREMLGRDTDGMLKIIDAALSKGTHAEVRLFYYLMILGHHTATTMPYLGITQLCCACCNTLFKGHGLDYVQGSAHRAGTHGTHYPGWKLDPVLQSDEVLTPFFGKKLSLAFKLLTGEIEFNGKRQHRQTWVCAIIQDLASLWYRANPERLVKIDALGFTHGAIACDESNYPDFISHFVSAAFSQRKPSTEYASMTDFRRALCEQFDLKIDFIPGDGNCQFRAAVRALRCLNPALYRQLVSNSVNGFTFFGGIEENIAMANVRRMAVQYMRDHQGDFLPYLVPEEGMDFDTVEEFADYMENENVFGNHLTLQAMVATYARPIIVLQPGTPANPVAVQAIPVHEGDVINVNEAIILVYNGEDHYDIVLHEPDEELSEAFYQLIANNYRNSTTVAPAHAGAGGPVGR